MKMESRNQHPVIFSELAEKPPPYIYTCLEEISRNCCTYSVFLSGRGDVKMVPYQKTASSTNFPFNEETRISANKQYADSQFTKSELTQSILQHYQPDFPSPPSTYKREPPSHLKKVLEEEPFNYYLLMSVGPIVLPPGAQQIEALKCRAKFEPIFGCATIYALVKSSAEENLIRVSESFHFDCTGDTFRDKVPEIYGSDADAASKLSACLFNIAPEYKKADLFLVVQLSKVLTSDGDKAVSAYMRSSFPEKERHEDSLRRLADYRQPLALSFWKLFDESERLQRSSRTSAPDTLNLQFYGLRNCINDATLKQVGYLWDNFHRFSDFKLLKCRLFERCIR